MANGKHITYITYFKVENLLIHTTAIERKDDIFSMVLSGIHIDKSEILQ